MAEDTTNVEETTEVADTTTEGGEKPLEDLSTEELEERVKQLEDSAKTAKNEQAEIDKRQSLMRRSEKATEKIEKFSTEKPVAPTQENKTEFTVSDIVDLRDAGFREDSEEGQKILSYIESGQVASAKEALGNDEVQAVLKVIETRRTVAATVDENDSEDALELSRKEVVNQFNSTGDVSFVDGKPDPDAVKTISDALWK